ncbi:MAG: hypothetical protein IT342_21085 [Candidatus Melainabacteria bacterium]|nr:hypothetical protein [Candidatus Melainabacteria bacterium]
MSYHGHKNIEQSLPMEGHSHRAAHGSTSEAFSNEVFSELSKGQAHMFKKGIAGSSAEECFASELQGGGLKKGEFGIANAEEFGKVGCGISVGNELKKMGFGSSSEAEIAKAGGKGMACDIIDKKHAELKHGFGESYAQKALEKNNNSVNAWDYAKVGLGAAMGPVGWPMMIAAEARIIRDALSSSNSYAETGSGGYHKEMIQRQKMLKSWKSSDE